MNETPLAPYECYKRVAQIAANFAQDTYQSIYTGGVDYPWTKQGPNARPFAFQQQIATPPIDTIFHNVINVDNKNCILVPTGYDGAINSYGANFTGGGFVDGSGDLVWRISRNGVPIKNFEFILTERGDPNQPIPVNYIRIYSGDRIQFLINHAANVTLNDGFIICDLGGFFYPNT